MAAKVTERLWEIGDIVDVLEACERTGGLSHAWSKSAAHHPEHDNSCGQTCVAMLAGVAYEDVTEFMGRSYTDTRDIRNGLRKFGLKSAKRLVQFRGNKQRRDYKELNASAVLKLVAPTHRGSSFHWVVWDAKCRRILDPQTPRYKIPPARITSFLSVWS